MSRKANKRQRFQKSRGLAKCFVAVLLLLIVAEFDLISQLHAAASATEKRDGEAIPLEEVIAEAEATSARLRDLRDELASDGRTGSVARQLPALAREIETRVKENRSIVAQRPALEILDTLEAEWSRLRRRASGYNREVTARLTRLQQHLVELQNSAKLWQQTRQLAETSGAPPALLSRIDGVVAEINETSNDAERERGRALTLQSRLAAEDARIGDALAQIDQARDDIRSHLFTRDAPAIWRIAATLHEILSEGSGSFFRQSEAFSTYAAPQLSRVLAHLLLLGALIVVAYWLRTRARSAGFALDSSTSALEQPLAIGFLLSSLFIPVIYPQAPRLASACFGFLALVPSAVILRRAAPRGFRPFWYALLLFYVLDQIRTLAAAVPLIPRLLFLVEMIAAAALVLTMLAHVKTSLPATSVWRTKLWRAALTGALIFAAAALAANAIGYVTLGTLLGNALLGGAYFGLILLALTKGFEAATGLCLRLPPLSLLSAVRRYGELLRRRVRGGLWLLAAITWTIFVFRKLLLRDSLFDAAEMLFTARLAMGSLRITFGDLVAFGLTIWAAFLVSRFVRFVLDEEIYPRVPLAPGLPYAISTMMHYAILLIGFLAAVAVLGVDMTKVTILAGAFSVGVGLGLQNIFNNFVSGVILLFERPVKVGDVIQIEDVSGVVEHIGIRASILRTNEGSEVIMPNGKLISDRVINWTLTNRQHSIELPIAVAPGADPTKVVKLLERAAGSHPLIAKHPRPQALLVKLGPDALGLELRVWTDRLEQWMEIRSELAIKVSAALAEENIAIH